MARLSVYPVFGILYGKPGNVTEIIECPFINIDFNAKTQRRKEIL